MIQAIVLAAGESKRMKKPKPLLALRGTTFLEHIVTTLQDSLADRVTVVLGAQAEAIAGAVDLPGAELIVNGDYRAGQLSSMIAALRRVPPDTEAMLLCLVDHPFLTVELVNQLIAAFCETGAPIVIPTFERRRGHPTLFAASLFDQLLHAPIEEGARQVVYANEENVLEVPVPSQLPLIGVNTPEDYRLHVGGDP